MSKASRDRCAAFGQRGQVPDATVLGPAPRNIAVEYGFEAASGTEGALGLAFQSLGAGAPMWVRSLERSLGRVRARTVTTLGQDPEQLRLIYLPALRNPVDELSRRETRVLLELLRAEQLRNPSTGTLASVRQQAESLLSSLTSHQLLVDVQGRIAENLKVLTSGVNEHFAFLGTQRVDDAYLARIRHSGRSDAAQFAHDGDVGGPLSTMSGRT